MEIQIPLVIFTSFLAWAAGIFGTQCILALQKRGGAVQLPALICSAVVLVVGGIAVVFHLTHPFNLFNHPGAHRHRAPGGGHGAVLPDAAPLRG